MTDYRVRRGGGWRGDDATSLAARARLWLAPSLRGRYLGFRCVFLRPTGSDRVFQGGSWDSDAAYCRAANRNGLAPDSRYADLGTRIVRRKYD